MLKDAREKMIDPETLAKIDAKKTPEQEIEDLRDEIRQMYETLGATLELLDERDAELVLAHHTIDQLNRRADFAVEELVNVKAIAFDLSLNAGYYDD